MASFFDTGDPNAHKLTDASQASVPEIRGGQEWVVKQDEFEQEAMAQLARRCSFWKKNAPTDTNAKNIINGLITLINQDADLCETLEKADLSCPLKKGELIQVSPSFTLLLKHQRHHSIMGFAKLYNGPKNIALNVPKMSFNPPLQPPKSTKIGIRFRVDRR